MDVFDPFMTLYAGPIPSTLQLISAVFKWLYGFIKLTEPDQQDSSLYKLTSVTGRSLKG